MKLKLRFNCFFTIGLLFFILYMGIVMAVFYEGILPLLGIRTDADNIAVFLTIFMAVFISGGVLFSLYFVHPMLLILSIIKRLSEQDYDLSELNEKIYTRNNKLKKAYWLYKEVIADLYQLSRKMEQTEIQQTRLKEAKEEWIRGVSHDIKTPLSYVIGYSALLLNIEYTWSEEEQRSFLSEIYTKGKYIEELVGDLNLSFKLEELRDAIPLAYTSFDFIDFIRRLLADVANDPRAVPYSFSLKTDKQEALIHADQKLLYRAIQNLLINAVQHNPEGTQIQVHISILQEHLLAVDISDNGVGMEKEVLENLFTRYYRNETEKKSDLSGGIGLVIMKNIIEAHGGHLSVESIPQSGTVFHIALPSVPT